MVKISRKDVLQLGLAGAAAHVLSLVGCSDDESVDGSGAAGTTGSAGKGGSAGSGGGGGSAGNGGSAGAGGNGGSAGTAGNGGTAGAGGFEGCTAMIAAAISLNHADPHTLEIPLADIEAGVEMSYETGGPSGHCHAVTLTAADFTTLQNGGSVTLFSCNGGDHEYVLSCAPNAPAPADPMCSMADTTGTC